MHLRAINLPHSSEGQRGGPAYPASKCGRGLLQRVVTPVANALEAPPMTDSRSRWIDTRDAWLRDASDKQVLDVVAKVAGGCMFDEMPGETIERTQTILWLAGRGQ